MTIQKHALFIAGGLLQALFAVHSLAQTLSTIHVFKGTPSDGAVPNSLVGSNGVLYGATFHGGASSAGTVYSLTPPVTKGAPWREMLLHSFAGLSDGNEPAGVSVGGGGVLYAVTGRGGIYGYGTAFSLTPPATPGGAWVHSVLYNFNNREDPNNAPLSIDAGGVLYGTSEYGGASDQGTVFSLTPPTAQGGQWSYSLLYSFPGGGGPAEPQGSPAIGAGGVLYGVAYGGIVYSLTPPATQGGEWTYSLLFTATGPGGGLSLGSGVTVGAGGVLYGATLGAPPTSPNGVVFSLSPPAAQGATWTYAELYSFPLNGNGGEQPESPLVVGAGGILYGATQYGGDTGGGLQQGFGVVFSLTPPTSAGGAWTETVLHSFLDGGDGSGPCCVVLGGKGNLYGIAVEGSSSSAGSAWEIRP